MVLTYKVQDSNFAIFLEYNKNYIKQFLLHYLNLIILFLNIKRLCLTKKQLLKKEITLLKIFRSFGSIFKLKYIHKKI